MNQFGTPPTPNDENRAPTAPLGYSNQQPAFNMPVSPFPYAMSGNRVLAAAIDAIVLGIVYIFALLNDPAWIASILISAAYFIGFIGWRGATPGMMVLHIKVIGETGQPVSYRVAAIRFIIPAIVGIGAFLSAHLSPDIGNTTGFLGLIDVVWIVFDPRRQALHDKMARTLVVPAMVARQPAHG